MSDGDGVVELYRKYRPKNFRQVVGQDDIVDIVKGWFDKDAVPHALLLTGLTGSGKTSLARLIAKKLRCKPPRDLIEINAADATGVDMVRSIRESIHYQPLSGDSSNRCWIMDEAALLSTQAQSALLKILEETPNHAYIILCTTDPQKLLPTVKNRCSQLTFKPIPESDLIELCNHVLLEESGEMSETVLAELAKYSEGSARRCLVKLAQLLELPDDETRLKSISCDVSFTASIADLCKLLTTLNRKPTWKEVAKVLKVVLDNNEPESIRYAILGWLNTALLNAWSNCDKSAKCMHYFLDNTYDSKKAGIAWACYMAWKNA
ncbi:MAG: ATP-binding protein [Planctomycetaceae bacterium]|jgi:DNA polymerase-3 subunit gamma/tau|nr:ATP-binding protein [Planctomycetaceae bacterium]